jgi:hypothetical protein
MKQEAAINEVTCKQTLFPHTKRELIWPRAEFTKQFYK